jgi:hypothetical protein
MATESLLPFEVLPTVAYLAQFAVVRQTDDSFTHGALLSSPSSGKTEVFLKYYVEKAKPSRGLVNEAVGYLLAKSCGLPVPARAFVVDVSGERLLEAHPALQGLVSAAHSYPCWATSVVPGTLVSPNHRLVIEILRKWNFLSYMLAFDDWVANSDRTKANIVLTGKQTLTLIDHGHIGGSLYWMPDLLPIDESFRSPVASELWPKSWPASVVSQMVQRAAEHSNIFIAVKPRLRKVIDLLASDNQSANSLMEFLEARANSGYDRMKKTHGVLI